MRDRKLATRYARALLQALPDDASAEAAGAFLQALSEAFRTSKDLRDVALNPAIPKAAVRSALDKIAETHGASRLVRNFLSVLVERSRAGLIPTIAELFTLEKEAAQGIVRARVQAASGLAPDLEARLKLALERLTGKEVRVTLEVEPALIGGAVATVGSVVYDGSLRTQLARLRHKMAEE